LSQKKLTNAKLYARLLTSASSSDSYAINRYLLLLMFSSSVNI